MSYNAYKNTLIAIDHAEQQAVAILPSVDHWGVKTVIIKLPDGTYDYRVDHPVFGDVKERLTVQQVRSMAFEGQLTITASTSPDFEFPR